MQKKKPGILLYGYQKTEAESLQQNLTDIVGGQLELKSATAHEQKKVKSILKHTFEFQFRDESPKIMLFFEMNDELIQKILSSFPHEIKRPIFCGLTEHNINWKFQELIEHLLAEQKMIKKQLTDKQNQHST